MSSLLSISLVTPEKKLFTEDYYEIIVPTESGEIAILPNHLPITTLVKPGVLSLRKAKDTTDKDMKHIALASGILHLTGSEVTILAEFANSDDSVTQEIALAAKKRAEELKEQAKDDVALADATAALERSIAQLKLAEFKKKRRL